MINVKPVIIITEVYFRIYVHLQWATTSYIITILPQSSSGFLNIDKSIFYWFAEFMVHATCKIMLSN